MSRRWGGSPEFGYTSFCWDFRRISGIVTLRHVEVVAHLGMLRGRRGLIPSASVMKSSPREEHERLVRQAAASLPFGEAVGDARRHSK